MLTDITRQLSASVYFNPKLAEKIISFVRNPFNSIVDPAGINSPILLKHALNARSKVNRYYWLLLVPAIAFLVIFCCPISGPIKTYTLIILYLILLTAVIIKDQNSKSFIKKHFLKESFNINFQYDGPDKDLLNTLEKKTCKNIVYYSGYSPFVGSGFEIGGWSFVVDIDKGKSNHTEHFTPKLFFEDELYFRVSQEILKLKIPNLTVENKMYFNGKMIRENKDVLPDKYVNPVVEVSSEFIKKAMNSGVENARFYKMIQVCDWGGDLILTSFLRFQKNEKTLFVENNYYILPPIKEEFKIVDKMKQEKGVMYYIKWFLRISSLQVLIDSLSALAHAGNVLQKGISAILGISEEAERKHLVKVSPDYDYGSETSIRQEVSQRFYLQHFQKLDKERYFKVIDKRIFNAICEFLDSKDIDTSEFKERETSILNNGIIVNGGNLTSQNVVVGKGSAISNLASSKN